MVVRVRSVERIPRQGSITRPPGTDRTESKGRKSHVKANPPSFIFFSFLGFDLRSCEVVADPCSHPTFPTFPYPRLPHSATQVTDQMPKFGFPMFLDISLPQLEAHPTAGLGFVIGASSP
jgi:hypothetical protein